MDLVREILDEQVVDGHGRALGKVDGIVLALTDGQPPRVAAIEVSPVVAARRIHPALGRWVLALFRWLRVGTGEPLRVPIADIKKDGINLRVNVDGQKTAAFAWERWLRSRVIGRIPGSRI